MRELDDYLKHWAELGESVRKQLVPFGAELHDTLLRAQKQAEAAASPMLEVQRNIMQATAEMHRQQRLFSRVAASLIPMDFSPYSEITKSLAKTYAQFDPIFEELDRSARELPPVMREALLTLGQHGWYLDLEWTTDQLLDFQTSLAAGDIEGAERELIAHFDARLDSIEKTLIERFPHRERFVRAAFAAHRREEYELSIPVLFAQTDGICYDQTKRYLFMRKNQKPGVATYASELVTDALQTALLTALCNVLPISASEKERDAGANLLNRHTVLHGESLSYPTRTNSLKAISLINYVGEVLWNPAA